MCVCVCVCTHVCVGLNYLCVLSLHILLSQFAPRSASCSTISSRLSVLPKIGLTLALVQNLLHSFFFLPQSIGPNRRKKKERKNKKKIPSRSNRSIHTVDSKKGDMPSQAYRALKKRRQMPRESKTFPPPSSHFMQAF